MNKNTLILMTAAALVCMMIFAACRNPVEPAENSGTQAQYGTVRISFNDGLSRTIYPNKDFDAYVYTFTPNGGAPQVLTPANGVFTLEVGDWSVRVDAYVGAVAPENMAAWGDANFTLAVHETKTVPVTLAAQETTGVGIFTWHITYPAGTTVETFTLKKLPGLADVALNLQAGATALTGTVTNVPAGAYMLDIRLANGGLYAGTNEVVYIYALLTTEYGTLVSPVVFEGQDFFGLLTNLADVAQYLNEHTGGTNAANPILLPLAFDLGIMMQSGSGWRNLLDVIAAADKYVALDLSPCTMSGTVFNPDSSVATGKDKIVFIDLPDVAASIAGGDWQNQSFMSFSSLTAVTAKYVADIGDFAFYNCTSLESVSLPAVTSIGNNAFYNCTSLTSVSLPVATSIGYYAFENCTSLTGVSLPAATSIGDGAFSGCTSLTSVSLPAATSIVFNAFRNCTGLTSVFFPLVTSIGESAFSGCTSLTSVSFPAATSIGYYAFENCTSLTSVSFPAVTSIGGGVFRDCTSLTSISFPASASLSSNPFSGCINLTAITVTGNGSLSVIEGGKALVRNNTELAAYPSASGNIAMNTITSIGNNAFSGCTTLTDISFPLVTSINNNAFSSLTSLTSVSFPAATSIGNNAFYNCTSLESVSFPAATSIGNDAFLYCTSLESVSFPAATSIGNSAFSGCTSLTDVSLPAAASIGSGAFSNTGSAALTITLGAAPPRLGADIFESVYGAKNVTVQFPFSGTAAYGNAPVDTTGQNWGNAFRGRGWSGFVYLGGTVSGNINLTYVITGEGASFAYYWVNEQDILATAGGASGNAFTVLFGNSLTITANGNGYINQRWFIDGVEVIAQAGNAAYTFTTIDKTPKRYTVGLIVEKGGRYYNANFLVTVE